MQTSLKDFVAFIQTTWGILAGVTTFFPFVGSLLPFMPVPDGERTRTSIMAFISSAFMLYLVFLMLPVKDLPLAVIFAVIFFACALTFFISSRRAERKYQEEEAAKARRRQDQFGLLLRNPPETTEEETHKWLSQDDRMVLFYILTFIFLTGAFSVLAAADYWRGR